MTNARRLEDRKKKQGKETNKQTKNRKVRPLDFVIMENEIRAASKLVPVDCSKDGHAWRYLLGTSCSNFGYRYPSDKSLPSG